MAIVGIMSQPWVARCRCGGDVHSPTRIARIRLLKKNTTTLSKGVIPSIFVHQNCEGEWGEGLKEGETHAI
jgi:hypothetical protein